ncbi:hypothetical protein ACLKA6_012251 [Drosophila palustris]
MMCDQEERPDAISQDEDQEKAREDIEEMLDMIYKEASEPGCSVVKRCPEVPEDLNIVGTNDENPLIFPGRYVTKVVCVFPLEVSKRFVRPHLTSDGCFQPSAELIVHKLFGIPKLGNLLLLITPTPVASRRVEKYIVHCYAVDTQWHLGVTSLIGSERDLVKSEQNPEKYSVIFCSSYIELEDAFMPTSIKGQLFDVLRKRSMDPTMFWYKGNQMTLEYWSSDLEHYQKESPVQISTDASSPLMQGKRAAAGCDRVSGRRESVQMTRSKRKLNEVKQRNRAAITPHHISASSALLRPKPRVSEMSKMNADVRIRINSKSTTSINQPSSTSNQQQLQQFPTNPIQKSGQKERTPKSNDKLKNSGTSPVSTAKLPQSTPHPSSTQTIAVPAKGRVLGKPNKSDTLLRREREWVKFVGSSSKRRQRPSRNKE